MRLEGSAVTGREPLLDYPWRDELDRLLKWLLYKDSHIKAFCFDVIMSAAYIDATSGIERSIEQCQSIQSDFNSHLGFINLCSPCYVSNDIWVALKSDDGFPSIKIQDLNDWSQALPSESLYSKPLFAASSYILSVDPTFWCSVARFILLSSV